MAPSYWFGGSNAPTCCSAHREEKPDRINENVLYSSSHWMTILNLNDLFYILFYPWWQERFCLYDRTSHDSKQLDKLSPQGATSLGESMFCSGHKTSDGTRTGFGNPWIKKSKSELKQLYYRRWRRQKKKKRACMLKHWIKRPHLSFICTLFFYLWKWINEMFCFEWRWGRGEGHILVVMVFASLMTSSRQGLFDLPH